ncbi:MAG: SDR family oxidoreductase [Acidobacteria bacterium]|nr:SDR family oxidoreductase [Acidobacteriota bacterium]
MADTHIQSEFWDEALVERYRRHEYRFDGGTLQGKIILIPGGAGGLGAATVALLLKEGALPVVGYRSNRERARAVRQALEQRHGGELRLVEGDLLDPAVQDRYLEEAANWTGSLYGAVFFVGDPARVPWERLDAQALEDSFRSNYVAPVLFARKVADALMKRGLEGSLVFLSSMQGVGVFESSLSYAAPKSALVHAMKILARQWGAQGIRCNAVAPGVNLAGMAEQSIRQGKYDHYVRERVVPRFGRPEDVARVVRLLLEPDNYITGQVITVDGGLTLRR